MGRGRCTPIFRVSFWTPFLTLFDRSGQDRLRTDPEMVHFRLEMGDFGTPF